ncbi:MAG: poly-gamma-glutamate system protein [Spirochaetia bacterium]|jgi:poly-gamma-glutamate system protein|nr:poly-gamma-glutamate system protein [Spirochaetia bacterium]
MHAHFQRARIPLGYLAGALAAASLGFALLVGTKIAVPYPLRETQLAAARLMQEAEQVLKKALLAQGLSIEAELDPNQTGLIGPEWTALTTTLGILEAKRTTLNPNFAALMVRYFHQAGLQRGDLVAVGASGSFPGITIATLCAAREMGLKALTIASFGSSMYGATRPEFTTPKMVRILSDAALIPNSLIAVSPGADEDYGENPFFEDSRQIIADLAAQTGVEFIDFDPPDLVASIARRLELFDHAAAGEKIACFVNIGGASPNSGTSSYTLDFPQGLVVDPPRIPATATRGLVYEYAARGIPVINLLNIRSLVAKNGLPYDPIPLPSPGEGDVYNSVRYNTLVALATVVLTLCLLALPVLRRVKKRKRQDRLQCQQKKY